MQGWGPERNTHAPPDDHGQFRCLPPAHTARTATDGKWRAPDSLGYNEHVGAVAAVVAQHLEEALAARFGLEWTARDDGHGFEIKGIPGR